MPTAWDLIGTPDCVRVKGGHVVWEAVVFIDDSRQRKVKLSRLVVGTKGIRQINRYVSYDAELEIVDSSLGADLPT